MVLKPFGIPEETHMKTIGDEKILKLKYINESVTQGDKFWKLFTENISDLDEEKFNRRAAWKIWRETSTALAEHVMHLQPAYKDRFELATKKNCRDHFNALLTSLKEKVESKNRGELLFDNNYKDYMNKFLKPDLLEANCTDSTAI